MRSFIGKVLKIGLILFLICIIAVVIYVVSVANSVTLNKDVMTQEIVSLKIYDKNGEEISLCGYKNNLSYEELPQNLVDAFVCTEDKNYFSHSGVDYMRIAKAMVKNILSLSPNKEGASTITQQFIKNTHLSLDKTFERKIKEAKLALELEQNYSKEEILSAYFNILYFGNSIYGVSNACENFFSKKPSDITLAEAALLAGVVKNPAKYSPLRNYDNSIERRNFILSEMYKDGYVSESEYLSAKSEPLVIPDKKNIKGLSFLNAVIDEASDKLGLSEKELAYSHYSIYTDYNPGLQLEIENSLKNEANLPSSENGKRADCFALVVDNESVLVSAYYNSYSCNVNEFYRQPGSTIKPFVSYLPSMAKGRLHPASPVLDEKINIDGYSPRNFREKYYGWTNVRYALSKSLNSVAVKLMNENGVEDSIEYAKKYGFEFHESDYTLATALGGMTKGVTPLQLTSAYTALANGGYFKKAGFIRQITDLNGTAIYDSFMIVSNKIESEENVYLMTDMLKDCAKSGTASRLNVKEYEVAAKTGTVAYGGGEKNNDIWNVSYTSENTLCVWMGNVDNSEENALSKDSLAGVYPTEIAKKALNKLYDNSFPFEFPCPEGVCEIRFSKSTYENEHILLKAGEYLTKEETLCDIFNGDVLLADTESKAEEKFENFEVEVKNNLPLIRFNTNKNVVYTLLRYSLLSEEKVVVTVCGDGKLFEYKDKDAIPGMDYVYKIDAMLINYKNEVKHLGASKEIYVTLPYDFWLMG